MLVKLAAQLIIVSIALLAATSLSFAHPTKVVVVPLDSDQAQDSKIIFVTKGNFTGDMKDESKGDFDGASGADRRCQEEADAQGSVVQGRKFMAWVSGGLTINYNIFGRWFRDYKLPYLQPDGRKIADSFSDLVDGFIDTTIAVSADGINYYQGTNPLDVWTGVLSNGYFYNSTLSCNYWTSSSASVTGRYGDPGWQDGQWTDIDAAICSNFYRLYCIEQ